MLNKIAKKKKLKKAGMSDRVINTIFVTILVTVMIIILYPLIYVISSSFSSGTAVSSGRVLLWPVEVSVQGYKIVFSHQSVWIGYMNSIYYTVVGTIINLLMNIMIAYPLSRKNYPGKGLITTLFIFPMFFSGGMIPKYILLGNLNLLNTRAVMMVSVAYNMSNVILMRTYFQNSIPDELLESSKMDGITDLGYLMKIVLPLSKATISVILLYYAVGHWNAYFNGLMYLRDRALYPLQLILKEIMNASQVDASMMTDSSLLDNMKGATDTMKYALIVVASVPMIIIYPFVQKFFQKGVMLGALKG